MVQLNGLFFSAFGAFETTFHGFKRDTVDEELWLAVEAGLDMYLDNPAVEYWWLNKKPKITDRFIANVEKLRVLKNT